MLYHLLILKARTDLTPDDRRAFVEAFRTAVTTIDAVRAVRLGTRVLHGAGYEASADTKDLLGIIEFDDLAGLQAYLRHPAHTELGARFGQSFNAASVYDFETGGLERLDSLI